MVVFIHHDSRCLRIAGVTAKPVTAWVTQQARDLADAVKLLARAHQTAIWERTRQVLPMQPPGRLLYSMLAETCRVPRNGEPSVTPGAGIPVVRVRPVNVAHSRAGPFSWSW